MTPGASPGAGFAWPEAVCAPVRALPDHERLWVALSGGLDSTLLLHLCVYCYPRPGAVNAIHVNHQLQPNAGETETFCESRCQALGVPLQVRRVTVPVGDGAGVEVDV